MSDAGPDAVGFVYLAGYGLQYGTETYYVPIGADVSRDADIPLAAIRLADLTGPLDALAAKARFVVLDAGYKLPFRPKGPPLAKGFALLSSHADSLVAYNTAPGTVAEPAEGGYGIYAKSLAAELRAGGLSPDELFERVRLRVTGASHGAEIPWETSGVDASFRFFERDAGAPAPAASPAQLADLRSRPIRDLPVEQAFNAALARDTIAAYSAFLAAYPENPLARRIRFLLAVRREAETWRETTVADTAEAFWSYLARYPRGPHEAASRARLEELAAPPRPPEGFMPIAYDVAPPPPDELPLVDASAIAFDVLPPPPPDYWLPPEPAAFADLAPPPLPQDAYLLPVPVFVPLPDYVDPPAFVILPLGNYFYDPRGLPAGRPHRRIHQRMPDDGVSRREAGALAIGAAAAALPAAVLARRATAAQRGMPAEMRGAPQRPDELGRHALPGVGGRPLPPLEAGRPGGARNAVPRNEEERRQFERERALAVHQLEEDARRQRDLVRQEVERRRTMPGATPSVPGAGVPRLESRPRPQMPPQPDGPRMVMPQIPPPQRPAPVFRSPPPPRIVVSPRPGGFGGGRPGGFSPPVRPASAPMVRPVAPVGRPFPLSIVASGGGERRGSVLPADASGSMKVAALRQHLVHRAVGLASRLVEQARHRRLDARPLGARQQHGAADLVGAGKARHLAAEARQQGEQPRQILGLLGDDVDDAAFALQAAGDGDEARADDDRAQHLEHLRPDDDVGDARLVLDGQEDRALGRAGPLAHQHQPGDGDPLARGMRRQRLGSQHAAELRADEGDGVGLEAERQVPVVLDDVLAERHRRQPCLRLALGEGERAQQRQIVLVAGAVEAAHDPQGLAPVEAERAERIRLGQLLQHGRRDLGAQPQVADRIVAGAAPRDEAVHVGLAEALHLAKAEPDRVVAEDIAGAIGVARVDGRARLFLLPPAGEGGPAKRGRMRELGVTLDVVDFNLFGRPCVIRPDFAPGHLLAATAGEGRASRNSVESQSEKFTSTSANCTPCSRASRTICAGA